MPIDFNSATKLITLTTDTTTYQMKVDPYGYLIHLYYGARTSGDMSYLVTYADRSGMCGCPYDVHDRTYSLDVLPQEFPFQGSGDMRSPLLVVRDAEGAFGCDLRYVGHTISNGMFSLPGLPAVYSEEDDEAQSLSVQLRDERLGLEVELLYGVLPHFDVITRALIVTNAGNASVTVERFTECLSRFCSRRS